MGSITFTDEIGLATLTNGAPWQGSRFSNWIPTKRPKGSSATRASDGALSIFRTRTDYGASFEVRGILARETASPEGLNVTNPNIADASWGFSTASPGGGSAVRSSQPIGPNNEFSGWSLLPAANYGSASFARNHSAFGSSRLVIDFVTRRNGVAGASLFGIFDATSVTDEYFYTLDQITGAITVNTPPPVGHSAVTQAVNLGSTAGVPWWRVRTDLIIDPTHQYNIYLGWTGQAATTTAGLYVGDVSVSPGQRNADIADRLIAHLLNGGTCSVVTRDSHGQVTSPSTYATCGLMPGTTPQLVLADPKLMEYRLSLSLINLAVSPVPMVCHYV